MQLHLFACEYLVTLTPFVEKTIFAPMNCLGILVKNQYIIKGMVYFWAFHTILLIYMSILMPLPHHLNYYNFVLSFKIRKYESSKSVL